jgi:hypothetical protein
MTGAPRSPLPGTWLEAIARAVFDEPALSHAALPTIADFQQEWIDAGEDRRRCWLARWRGYVAFWSLMVMAPIVFRAAAIPSRPPSSRARRLGVAAIALIVVGAIGFSQLDEFWREWLFRQVPGGMWRTVGLITPVAFLAGPMAFALVLLRWRMAGPWNQSAGVSALMLFSLLSVTVAALSSGASVVGLFVGVAQTGSGGYGVVVPVVSDAALAMRNGLLVAVGCLIVAGAIGGRAWWRGRHSIASSSRMSRRLAVGWSALLAAILLGVDQLLRAHHDVMRALTLMAEPDPVRRSEFLQVLAQGTLEHSLLLLVTGGFALTAVVIVAGVKGWRTVRALGAHHLFTWVSRAAVIVAVTGAAYHARVVVADLASFHDVVDRLRANTRGPGT